MKNLRHHKIWYNVLYRLLSNKVQIDKFTYFVILKKINRLTNQTSRIMKKELPYQIVLLNCSFIKTKRTFFFQKILMLLGVISFSIFSVGGTTYYSKNVGLPDAYSSWGTNTDGTGTAPANFTTNGDIFIVRAGITMVTDKNWTIGSGAVGNVVTLEINGSLSIQKNNTITINSYSQVILNNQDQLTILSQGNGKFLLSSNATLKTNSPYGIAGMNCPLPAADISLSTTANYEFNGTTDQATLGLPATVKNLTISNTSGIVTLKSALTASNITIKPKAKLTRIGTENLSVTSFDIQSDATNIGTFVDKGTGTLTVATATTQQFLTRGRNWYVSSPVANAPASIFSTAASVESYNEPTASWVVENGNTLSPMKGYIAVSPTVNSVVTFTGTLNNGTQSINLTRSVSKSKEGFNLVGNPYPSYLDWSLASSANTGVMTTIWYRTKTAQNTYTFDTYNASGNTHTSNGANPVSKLIPPMQGFWVRVNEGVPSATLSFNNTMRSHGDITSNILKAPSSIQSEQKILRLKVSNGTNSDEAIVLFNPNASDGFDGFDSPKMTNANPVVPEIYTLADNEHVVINGFSTVYYNTEIPLGFTTGEANTFSIQVTEMNNFDDGTVVILKDNEKMTDQEQILSLDKPYDFTSDIFSSANRFSLIFRTTSITTGTNEELANQRILINKNGNNQITVNCLSGLNANGFVSVYNAQGKLLVTKPLTNRISVLEAPVYAGIYLVKVINGAKCVSEKIIF